MTTTPRTDSAEPYGPPYSEVQEIHVPKAFARQLEHELQVATADLYLWKQMASTLVKHVPGVSDQDCKVIAAYESLKEKTK